MSALTPTTQDGLDFLFPQQEGGEEVFGGRLEVMEKLAKDEKEISRSFARGEWKSVKNRKVEIRRYQSYARESLQKSSRVNIRIAPQDLEGMQQKALEEGIPYQTLMASVIHKYVAGRLVERRT